MPCPVQPVAPLQAWVPLFVSPTLCLRQRLLMRRAPPHLQAQHDEVERAAMQRRTDEKARRVEAIEASRSALLAEMQRIKKDIQQQEAMLKAGSRSNQGQAQLGQHRPWLQDLSCNTETA